ncbi:hypothetical protein [Saccharopolyspora tripterygii]
MASDASLDRVLEIHLSHLRGPDYPPLEPVRRADGTVGRIDLALLGQEKRAVDRSDYLVVELKRPSVKITEKEVSQIKSYARAVAQDPQFEARASHWDFLLVGTIIDEGVRLDLATNPRGLLQDWNDKGVPVRIWVKTWSEAIGERKDQLRFFKDSLNDGAAREHAMDYLNRNFAEHQIPVNLRRVDPDAAESSSEEDSNPDAN